MFSNLAKLFFGSRNQRLLKKYKQNIDKINALEKEYEALSLEDIPQKTESFKQRFQQGESLDQILPEAFCLAREASKRTMQMRHFDVQLLGGMVLHEGKISEMLTGEGKTLMATLAAYLNALSGRPVHIVTVNDYLARRDAHWMGPLYRALGLTVGIVVPNMRPEVKRQSYLCDVVYATNNELGFDYLRNKMAYSQEECLRQDLAFAIVDEVDSILIDEARTPLIISGAAENSTECYVQMNDIVPKLSVQAVKDGPGDYSIDEKSKQVFLTEEGHLHVEVLLAKSGLLEAGQSLYDPRNIGLLHYLNAGLRAHAIFKRDVDYLVKDNEVMIVDEHTGRTMPGRRWSEGLHQAMEAKEGVPIQNENQTLASITFQNFFRLYDKLGGMTGTADTEAFEFQQIYGLEVVVIPPNKPFARKDETDLIYLSKEEKFQAIIKDIEDKVTAKQPVLVGTVSIEMSELLSRVLSQHKIKHQVLNAKYHEQEAQIIAEAGRPGAVTIATNMAGRGTDIVLGGSLEAEIKAMVEPNEAQINTAKADWQKRHDDVIAAGGLHIIGTERHESRRIDNQLRGRSGRQGDPGSSRFYLSLEDNLMRIFASDKVSHIMRRLGVEKGEAITHPWVNKAIENAQRKVEGHNFDIRKQLLEYDNVANDQRKVFYEQRDNLLAADDISENVKQIRDTVVNTVVAEYIPPESLDEMWDIPGLEQTLENELGLDLPIAQWLENESDLDELGLKTRIMERMEQAFTDKEALVGSETLRKFEKSVMLHSLDTHWRDHLTQMEHLRQSVSLRGYAQKDPRQEYKREAFNLFESMLNSIRRQVISFLSLVEVKSEADVESAEHIHRVDESSMEYQHATVSSINEQEESSLQAAVGGDVASTMVREQPKVGRNEPCPCGSGKKFKQCHGQLS
tara:strand:+ start:70148 stop:72865 length:2718 start_codon:yes stop_codon:yes gene_type:complete